MASLAQVDAVLRCEKRYAVGAGSVPWASLALMTIAGGSLYGAVMGSYGIRPLQMLYSAIKVPALLGGSTLICLPSFYAINTLLGLRSDFGAACRGVLAAQATVAVMLAALAPITLFAYTWIGSYPAPILFNGLQFALATLAGHLLLLRHYAPLIQKNSRHRIARGAWLFFYVFVAIQMSWVVRPFIGAPGMPTQFFREDAWSNAYVWLVRTVLKVFVGE